MDVKKPNILWLCTDQQRHDTLGCYNNKFVRTPNLDRLAENGVKFSRAYCQAPVCAPSRASFLTSRYPRTCRVRQNGQNIHEDEVMVTRVLKNAGYIGGLCGKLHLSACAPAFCKTEERRIDDGYDYFAWSHDNSPSYDWLCNSYSRWLDSQGVKNETTPREDCRHVLNGMPREYSQAKWCADRTIEFIEDARKADKPWFFSFNCFDPHHPFDPPNEYLDRYLPILDDIPLPKYVKGELETKPYSQTKEHRAAYGIKGHFPYDEMTEYDHKLVRAAYYALCDLVDDEIGRIIDYLDQTGELENTIIVFHSDHGESLGDHGIYLKGCYFYDQSIHVPLIMSWKGKWASGKEVNALVELIDIAPTLLDACGIDKPQGMQGRSFLSLLSPDNENDHFRDDVFCEYYKTKITGEVVAFASMIFDGRYKLSMVHEYISSYPQDIMGELYDLKNDPDEVNNLYYAPSHQDIKALLLEKFCNRQALTADALPYKSAPW